MLVASLRRYMSGGVEVAGRRSPGRGEWARGPKRGEVLRCAPFVPQGKQDDAA